MLKEIINDFIINKKTVITSAPGNGSTTLLLNILNYFSFNDICLLYNPANDIDRLLLNNYKNTNNLFLFQDSLDKFINFLIYIKYDINLLFIDPGDSILYNKKILLNLTKRYNKTLVLTSQIRQDPTKNGHIYSTIENLELFDYSIWIRNVSEIDTFFIKRYIDIFENKRFGNKFIRRYMVRFNKKTGIMSE